MPTQLATLCQETTLHQAWSIVKGKGAAGGIDGVTIIEFEHDRRQELQRLAAELRAGTWKPQPYMEIEVAKTKDPGEQRRLGMTAIRDKIVQTAIKGILEPRLERLFLSCSYGYRPGRGATKAIRRVLADLGTKKYHHVLRLDIDNFFDNIDHDILQRRLVATGLQPELVRLTMLCVQMGKVRQGSRQWVDTDYGTPQGAVLSPLLSNLYLHSFDQFAASQGVPYVRYADDFIFLTDTLEQAEEILKKTETHLRTKLKLSLNQPTAVTPLTDSFDFLGITFRDRKATITDHKRDDIAGRIAALEFSGNGFSPKSLRAWEGIANYYGMLLPQTELEYFDQRLKERIAALVSGSHATFGSKSNVQFSLSTFRFLSKQYQKQKRQHVADIVAEYLAAKQQEQLKADAEKNRKVIQQRKQEYRRMETETSGLLVDRPGAFVGLTKRGITITEKGRVIAQHHAGNLSHIVITGKGVSLSSNLIGYCMERKIPIDFFDHHGVHTGSVLSSRFIQNSLWERQASANSEQKNRIALAIIEGK